MPYATLAQPQGRVLRVGVLSDGSRPINLDASYYKGLLAGLGDLGYINGSNLEIEWRFAEGRHELLPILAAELKRLKLDAILTASTPATRAAFEATKDIPIVMTTVDDPIGSGFIKSLPKPGGNVTGFSLMSSELGPKQLELVARAVPKIQRVAVLVNPVNAVQERFLKGVQAAGQSSNITVLPYPVKTVDEINGAFTAMMRERAGAVIVSFNSLFASNRSRIAGMAAANRLATIGGRKEDVQGGYLMSYGPDTTDTYQRVASYVDKIYKGAKPADLPVQQPTKFEMFINGKTAKSLNLKIPAELLAIADKVIE